MAYNPLGIVSVNGNTLPVPTDALVSDLDNDDLPKTNPGFDNLGNTALVGQGPATNFPTTAESTPASSLWEGVNAQGDSGGPTFAIVEGNLEIVGVTSYGFEPASYPPNVPNPPNPPNPPNVRNPPHSQWGDISVDTFIGKGANGQANSNLTFIRPYTISSLRISP